MALILVVHLAGYAEAARIITITIDVDGKPFLEGGSGDNGSPPPAAVWRYLTSSLLSPAQGVAVAPDPADPLRATLKGKIHIEVRYGGKADVEELQLVRAGTNVGWTVAEDDVERIAKDIGLGIIPVVTPPPVATLPPLVDNPAYAPRWLWIAGGVVIFALLVAIWIVIARGRVAD